MALSAQQHEAKSATHQERKFEATGDDLVSVTVRKTDPNQKAGVKVVQKQDGIFITAINENGLLDNTKIEVGDKLLSINGKRLRRGENTRDFMKLIASSRDKVTMVVKKANSKQGKRNSPEKRKPQKLVQKDTFRKADGSFDYEVNPVLKSYKKAVSRNLDDKEQIRIEAKKLFPAQRCGLSFKKKESMLFVNGISLDSIFKDTELEFGDRVVSVNNVNFMTYSDAKYAATLLKRAKGDASIIVEKGWGKLDVKADVDPHHDLPSRESVSPAKPDRNDEKARREAGHGNIVYMGVGKADKNTAVDPHHHKPSHESFSSPKPDGHDEKARVGTSHGDVVTKMLDKLDMERKAIKERQADRLNKSFDSADGVVEEKTSHLNSMASPERKPVSATRADHRPFSDGLRFQQDKGDFICVSIKKNSELEPGVRVKKREGKFILHKLPEHEKRIPVGVQIFAINGRSDFSTVVEAKEIINATRDKVVLFINFNDLVAVRASDLLQLIGQ